MALLEAQRFGTPVVAGNIRGVPDVVLDGVSGYLFSEGDMQEMAERVQSLLRDDTLRLEFSRNASEFVLRERSLEMASGLLSREIRSVVG